MAVGRQLNLQGQWRLDVAHLRSIESAVAYDFDVLAGHILGGKIGYIVNGFTLYNSAGGTLIGASKANLRLATADGSVIHYNGDYNGSILMVPSTRAAESPVLTTGIVNYIGLNYVRAADASTSDIVQFLNTSVNPPVEVARSTPLAQTLNYTIVVSPNNFATQGATIVPIAKVTVDGGSLITAVVDARRMYLRLNQGGDATSAAAYTWGSRTVENMGSFTGGDKDFGHERNWKTAMMTRIWEIAGGLQWYSDTTDRNTKLTYGPVAPTYSAIVAYDIGDVVIETSTAYYCIQAGTGKTPSGFPAYWTSFTEPVDNFVWNGTLLKWCSLTLQFATNTDGTGVATYNKIKGDPNTGQALSDGQALYVDAIRGTEGALILPGIAAMNALGTPTTTPGARYILAWRRGTTVYTRDRAYEVGRNYTIASTSTSGVVRTATTSYAPTTPFAIMAASAANKAAATGLTRATISSGIITIGGETNDTQIILSATTGILASASAGSNNGLQSDGSGTGTGLLGVGGLSAGTGVRGTNAGTNAIGVHGYGTIGNCLGVRGEGTGTGNGVWGTGVIGITGNSSTSGGIGIYGYGTVGNAIGVKGEGLGSGIGVIGAGGTTSGSIGVKGQSTAADGNGVYGLGSGAGTGVIAEAGATGSQLSLTPRTGDPAAPANGNVWLSATDIKAKIGGTAYRLNTLVSAPTLSTGWSSTSSTIYKNGGWVNCQLHLFAGAAVSGMSTICTFLTGFVPGVDAYFTGWFSSAGLGTNNIGIFRLTVGGLLTLSLYDNGTSLVAPGFTWASTDTIRVNIGFGDVSYL